MKKVLWMNYIGVVIVVAAIIVAFKMEGKHPTFMYFLPTTLILTILFFNSKVKIPKALVLILNILICISFTFFIAGLLVSGEHPQYVNFAITTFIIIGSPFLVNVFMLYKDRYKKVIKNNNTTPT